MLNDASPGIELLISWLQKVTLIITTVCSVSPSFFALANLLHIIAMLSIGCLIAVLHQSQIESDDLSATSYCMHRRAWTGVFFSNVRPSCGDFNGGRRSAFAVVGAGRGAFTSACTSHRAAATGLKKADILAWRVERLENLWSSTDKFCFCCFCFSLYLSATLSSPCQHLSVGGCVCTGEWTCVYCEGGEMYD